MSGWFDRQSAEIQLGNGKLLVTLNSWGEIDQVFSPHPDAVHAKFGAFHTFVLVAPAHSRERPQMLNLGPERFEATARLRTGTQSLQVEYQDRFSPLRVVRTMGLHPTDAILLDSWQLLAPQGMTVGLMHQSVPWIGHSTSAQCSLYHPTFNGLVHHRGRRWVAIVARGQLKWIRVGHLSDGDRFRLWDGHRVYAPMSPDELKHFPDSNVSYGWNQVVQGSAVWGAMAAGPGPKIEFLMICGESEQHLAQLLQQSRLVETNRFFQMADGMVARRHAPAAELLERVRNPKVRALCERSIDVLHGLQDADTGALMAAAEVDPHSKMSGGYGYSWPRDGAYLASALGAWNFRERVERFFEFMIHTQDPSGAWWQRYMATGHAGPSWGRIQIDEPASVVCAAYDHFRRTQDLFWLERVWPSLEKGLSFLEAFHGPEHPLGLPSHDLWEERMGIHAYSLGVVASAFLAGAYMAGELSDRKKQAHFHEWGRALSTMIAEKFVTFDGPIRRSFIVHEWEKPSHGFFDEVPDVSLLGLIIPFRVFRKRDLAAQRILQMVRQQLWCKPVGGVFRYTGDHYRGGHPWILTTLWLGMVELSLGNHAEARKCLQWTMSKATPLGMLAEQVHKDSGKPFWVIPLAWSHAMFLLFARDVLDRHVEKEIWEGSTQL